MDRKKARISLPAKLPANVKMMHGRLYTLSVDRSPVYGERVSREDSGFLHEWSLWRSKLASMLISGASIPIEEGMHILYLGAASGTTVSHVSDIVRCGVVYAVEISPVEFSKLLGLAKRRSNIIPILGNARAPECYAPLIDRVDLIYQDISQRDQVSIYLRNMEVFHCRRGILCLKARSIDATLPAKDVLHMSLAEISKTLTVKKVVNLAPYQKEHWGIITG